MFHETVLIFENIVREARQSSESAQLEPVCLLAPWQPGLPGSLAACLEALSRCQVLRSSQALVNSSFLAALEEQLTGEIVLKLLSRVSQFL